MQLYQEETPTQVFSCEICKIFKNTYFEEHLRTAASVLSSSIHDLATHCTKKWSFPLKILLREKCPYSELFWPVFCSIRTEYGAPYSVGMRENADQNNSEYGHFLRSILLIGFMVAFRQQFYWEWTPV